MRKFLVSFGNFIFRWRDTIFTLVFLPSLYLVSIRSLAVGDFNVELGTSLAGFLIAFTGQTVRIITIGFGFVKRSGVKKKIHAEGLMQVGLFAHMRNPLYLGNFLIVTGSIISINMIPYYAIMLPIFYVIYIAITLAEEEYLRSKFGADYEEYLKSVPNRYLPGKLSSMKESFQEVEFTWKRYFKREYGSTVVIFASIFLVNLIKFRYRYDIAFDSPVSLALWALVALLVTVYILTRILTKMGKLEWEDTAPKH